MLDRRKKLAIAVFGVIYLVFGLIFVYMLFFNMGLSLDEKYDVEKGDKVVVFKNASSRVIKDIFIGYIDEVGRKNELMRIPAAYPGYETELDLSALRGESEIILVVEAPFHISVERKIALKASSTGLAYNLQFPGLVIAKTPLMFQLQMCNNLDFTREITVEENHEKEFFAEELSTKPVTLGPNGCEVIEYTLVPLKQGATVIYFNVKVANNTEKLEKRIEITG